MHPKGKVIYDHHHKSDRERAKLIHAAAFVSALVLTIFFVLVSM